MTALAPVLQAFFTDRLIAQRRASGHTIAGYRCTFRLLVGFASTKTGKRPSALDIADLDAKAKTAKGKAKTDIEAALPNIRALRDSVTTEYRSLELSSALTWDASKARVEKAVDDLKKAIDKAD